MAFTMLSGDGTINDGVLSAHGTGEIVVRASQSGNATYAAAHTDVTLTVEGNRLRIVATGGWPGIEGRVDYPADIAAPISEHAFLIVEGDSTGTVCDIITNSDGSPRFLRRHGRLYDRVK